MSLEQTLYEKSMFKGIPEVINLDGKPMLKIYRGLEVPEKDTVSEGDNKNRIAGTIDLTYPGIDWTPIRKFAEPYAGFNYSGGSGKQVILSALVPLDDPQIFNDSLDSINMLDHEWFEDEDGFTRKPNLQKLTDCLIIIINKSYYQLLKDVKVEYTDAAFEIK